MGHPSTLHCFPPRETAEHKDSIDSPSPSDLIPGGPPRRVTPARSPHSQGARCSDFLSGSLSSRQWARPGAQSSGSPVGRLWVLASGQGCSKPGGEQLPLQLAPPAQSWEELAEASVAYVRPLFLDSTALSLNPSAQLLNSFLQVSSSKPALCPGAFSAGSWGGLL